MNATRSRSKSSKSSASRRKSSAKSRASAKGGAKTAQRRGAKTQTKSRGAAKSARSAAASRSAAARGGTARASGTPIGQAIEILMNDHRKVEKLFRQGERAKKDPERLRGIVEEACDALTKHADIEEQHFYPVMREGIKETGLIAEARVEHGSIRQLIAELESGDPDDEQYSATFKVLSEYVKHHVKEEEGEIFPKARRARGEFEPLLQALHARDEAQQSGSVRETGASREQASSQGGRGTRSRPSSGRRAARGRAGDEMTPPAAESADESAVEQPRRGRRGESEETGETETPIHGRDQEPVEEGTHGSRESGR